MPVIVIAQTFRRAILAAAATARAKNERHKDLVLALLRPSNTRNYEVAPLDWKRSVQLSQQVLLLKWHVHEQTVTFFPDFFRETLQDAVVLCVAGLIEQVQVLAGASAQVLCFPSVCSNFSYRNLE